MANRNVNSARNPRWGDYQQTFIDIEVDFDEEDQEYVPFTANPNDVETHGADLYQRAVNGEFGAVGAFVPPANATPEQAMEILRKRRNARLAETDYVEMPTKWATLTTEQQSAWTTYRNALRDLPANSPNVSYTWNSDYTEKTLNNVTWPTKPE